MSEQTSEQGPEARQPGKGPDRRISATRTAAANGPGHPHFSQPVRQILLMLSVLALVLAGGWFAYGRILPIFAANRWLNGLILGVFGLGVLACFWQVAQLVHSVSWIERFASRRRNAVERGVATRNSADGDRPPRLLAPLAALLGVRGPLDGVISTGSARSILESVATRIEELRDITRYLANLLIFLGLLGTFYGLATTVPAVVDTIRALAPQDGESGIEVFDKLMNGLEAQLGGMATAFSSSLLGLAGSLVVGLLELFVTHGQNRFYRELEEWMSGFTRISLAGADSGDELDHAAVATYLEQMALQNEHLRQFYSEREAARDAAGAQADERILVMAQAIEALANRSEAEREASVARVAALGTALNRMTEGQARLVELAQVQTDRPAPTLDLTRIEAALDRLATELTEGREEYVAELRSDILVLTRAVRASRFNDPFRDDLLPELPLARHKDD
ncbi:hypothetical protein [Paracoccus sp. (in: a-proteobacteria)]|uniref:hypothetical protein n=1 Tax=Paracoccus sp. TaxID=267 RepID=UPI003A8AB844